MLLYFHSHLKSHIEHHERESLHFGILPLHYVQCYDFVCVCARTRKQRTFSLRWQANLTPRTCCCLRCPCAPPTPHLPTASAYRHDPVDSLFEIKQHVREESCFFFFFFHTNRHKVKLTPGSQKKGKGKYFGGTAVKYANHRVAMWNAALQTAQRQTTLISVNVRELNSHQLHKTSPMWTTTPLLPKTGVTPFCSLQPPAPHFWASWNPRRLL